jgi:hypothetical protein
MGVQVLLSTNKGVVLQLMRPLTMLKTQRDLCTFSSTGPKVLNSSAQQLVTAQCEYSAT